MRIEKRKKIWYCAEVICTESLGLGTYRFCLDFNDREIDIEFSRWGDPTGNNAQFVVQPYYFANNLWT